MLFITLTSYTYMIRWCMVALLLFYWVYWEYTINKIDELQRAFVTLCMCIEYCMSWVMDIQTIVIDSNSIQYCMVEPYAIILETNNEQNLQEYWVISQNWYKVVMCKWLSLSVTGLFLGNHALDQFSVSSNSSSKDFAIVADSVVTDQCTFQTNYSILLTTPQPICLG